MINLFCGLLAMTMISLFVGGLAYSIWVNTASIAFPVIACSVLLMAYVAFFNEIKSGSDHT